MGRNRSKASARHIVGYVDLDVTGIVDLIIDTINKEL